MEIFCDSVCKHGIIRNGKHNMRLGNSVCNGGVNIENIAELSWALNSNLIAVRVCGGHLHPLADGICTD